MTDAGDASRPPSPDADAVGRRGFLRAIGLEAVRAASSVADTAVAIRREVAPDDDGADTRTTLADTATSQPSLAGRGGVAARRAGRASAPGEAPVGFRSPYRLGPAGELFLLDQRAIPDALREMQPRSAADVVHLIRERAVVGAPVLGQVAAYAVWMAAAALGDAPFAARAQTLGDTARALVAAAPSAAPVRAATRRMIGRWRSLPPDVPADVLADALRAEADAIAMSATMDHARLARHGLALLPETGDEPVRILVHGSSGPLASGMVGTALGVVNTAVTEGRNVAVWIAETRPGLEGARLAAWEMTQAGIAHVVVADGAIGALLASGRIEAVLLAADAVAANGDVAARAGAYPIAVVAARHAVPLIVCVPTAAIDLATPDGAALPGIATEADAEDPWGRGPAGSPSFDPGVDVTPASLVSVLLTEEGAIHPPFDAALRDAVAASDARRPPIPAPHPQAAA